MSDFKKLLLEKIPELKGKEKHLPSGFQRLGNIVILNLKPEVLNYAKEIADVILNEFPYIRSVFLKSGPVSNEFREPKIEWLAGSKDPVTIHRENGCVFMLDVTKIMFAKGNLYERGRIPKLVSKGEIIVDMFAGIGYFSIPIAKFSEAKTIYAIEKNPVAVEFLKENIRLNKVGNKIIPVLGDCRYVKVGKIADRIIMGYLPGTSEYLPYAFDMLKDMGGILHYHDIFAKEDLWEKPLHLLETIGFRSGYVLDKITYKNIVKSYAPNIFHIVIDAVFYQR